jgi:hypothetical protein
MLAVAVCAGGARVRGRLRGGPSSRSEDGLADLGAISDCSGGDVRSAMAADAAYELRRACWYAIARNGIERCAVKSECTKQCGKTLRTKRRVLMRVNTSRCQCLSSQPPSPILPPLRKTSDTRSRHTIPVTATARHASQTYIRPNVTHSQWTPQIARHGPRPRAVPSSTPAPAAPPPHLSCVPTPQHSSHKPWTTNWSSATRRASTK